MTSRFWLAAGVAALAAACAPQEKAQTSAADRPYVVAASVIEAGRHISIVGGCNDCHTDGYNLYGEAIPEADRLKGSPMGHYGPWGTSYASNLRLVAASMSEDDWTAMMATRTGMPPMPWGLMHAYDARDMRALYAYIRSLGEAGEAMPAALPPGPPPNGPYTDYLTHAGPPPPPPAQPPGAPTP